MSFNYYHIRTDDFAAFSGGGKREIITRDNYEAYFVMYIDDELGAADRKAVENFIQQHPDLEEELVMLQQSVLHADEHIVFEQKEVLFKEVAVELVNEHNYTAYFVLYGDDELTNEEKVSVEQFVYKYPKYQAEFEEILQAKLVPDNTLTFPNKTYLYRTEEDDTSIIAFPWWRFAAAAIALLVIGSLAWYISTPNNGTVVADRGGETKRTLNVTSPQTVDPNKKPHAIPDLAVMPKTQLDSHYPDVITNNQPIVKSSTLKKNISKSGNILLASHVQQQSEQQTAPAAADSEKRFSAKPVDVAVGNSYEQPVVKTGILKQTINEPLAINTVAQKPEGETDKSPMYVLNTSINKTPLRGFFRKVARVVDKVTGDDNGKGAIRIANLEIALK